MAARARKVCASPGCPLLSLAGGSLCETHEQARMQRYNARRPSASQAGYGAQWRRIRDAYLAQHPYCALCGARGTHVDHIKAKADGGTDDEGNLQTLCARDHSKKTASVDGGFGNARRQMSGIEPK